MSAIYKDVLNALFIFNALNEKLRSKTYNSKTVRHFEVKYLFLVGENSKLYLFTNVDPKSKDYRCKQFKFFKVEYTCKSKCITFVITCQLYLI